MEKTIDKSQLPFLVDTDNDGNLVLSSRIVDEDIDTCNILDKDERKEKAVIVRLIGFDSEVLNEFSEIEIDEDLYDITNFTRAVSERLKIQKAK